MDQHARDLFLFFVFSAFVLLPFGVRTHDEAGRENSRTGGERAGRVPGRRLLLRTAILALVVTALYVANYINGWITVEDLIRGDLRPAPSDYCRSRSSACARTTYNCPCRCRQVTLTTCPPARVARAQHRLEIMNVATDVFAKLGIAII